MRILDYSKALLPFVLLVASISQAVEFETPPSEPGLLTLSPVFASLFSISDWLQDTANSNGSSTVAFDLPDGTHVDAFLFADNSEGPRPLIIADFGLMSSRWSGFAGQIIQTQFKSGALKANFLILDDMTSSSFYVGNKNVGIGGYEAGVTLIEVADAIKAKGIPYSSLHLFGESLGGLAVQEALIEDQRLGTHHFQSALLLSSVVDQIESTSSVFEAFGRNFESMQGPALSKLGRNFLAHGVENYNHELAQAKTSLQAIEKTAVGDFFYLGASKRLAERPYGPDWNPAVSHDTFEAYVETSSALLTHLDQITTPAIFISAKDDPIIANREFEKFAAQHSGNPNILTHETSFGSHCGLPATYGNQWTTDIFNQFLSLGSHP